MHFHCCSGKELHASASTPNSFCISFPPSIQAESSGQWIPLGKAPSFLKPPPPMQSGCAIVRARHPLWGCCIADGIQKESHHSLKWGASLNSLSSCPLPASVMGCTPSLLRTSHGWQFIFFFSVQLQSPFQVIICLSLTSSGWMDGWLSRN